MSAGQSLEQENIWFDKWRFEEAETAYQEHLARLRCGGQPGEDCGKTITCHASSPIRSSLAGEIAKAREQIQKSLNSSGTSSVTSGESCIAKRVGVLEQENKEIRQIAKQLELLVTKLSERVVALEKGTPVTPCKKEAVNDSPKSPVVNNDKEDDDDDFELFGSDDEKDEAAERVKQERLKAYEEKKAKKPQLIAKSNLVLDVKPWDDETDMAQLEKCVRSIEMDGLLWGASRLEPLAYGIKKLQITCVVEDDKVGTEDLEEKITAFEDYIQSMDIAAFNKI